MSSLTSTFKDLRAKIQSMSRIQRLDAFITVIAVIMTIYQFSYVIESWQDPIKHANTHLGFAMLIIFLGLIVKNKKFWPLNVAMAILALGCVLYIQYYYDDLVMRVASNTTPDIIVGLILAVLVIIASYQAAGWVLPILVTVFILYAFLGYLIPGTMQAPQLDFKLIVTRISLSFGIAGIYGYLLSISASLIFIFMIFAALVTTTGAVEFFHIVGQWVQNRVRSGPAMASVVSSALVGSICGLPGPIVMITGSFTIPAMKKAGYSAEMAGGIEAASSTAGCVLPPVMGVVAFIMVGFTGISYAKIALASAIPAVLYVISVALYVFFQARKMNMQMPEKIAIDRMELLKMTPVFVIPLVVLTALLLLDFSPMMAAFWGTLSIIAISLLRKKTRPSILKFIKGLRTGVEIGSKVAAMCATLGIAVVVMTMTGIGIKLPGFVGELSGGSVFITLALTWIICLILGCGLPESAAYILVAMTCAPILTKMGIPLLQAHLFVLFTAAFANLTPPVAIPAMFASQLSGGNYLKTAVEAAKAGLAGFILPFMIVFIPALVTDFSDWGFALTGIASCILMFFALQIIIAGYFDNALTVFQRVFLFLSPAAFGIFIFSRNYMLFFTGLAILVIFWAWARLADRSHDKYSALPV